MRNTVFIFTTIYCLALISCGDKQVEQKTDIKQVTPEALQDDRLEIKSYSRSGDLIEELYQELVEKTPSLKTLETDLETFKRKSNEPTEKFNDYDGKSKSYYSSANYKTTAIEDSLLRNKIITLLSNSNKQYSNKTTELTSLLDHISKNGATINDHHSVLKIVLTLPLIEKYQNDNLPDKKEFKDLIKTQEKLLNQTDSLTPSFN